MCTVPGTIAVKKRCVVCVKPPTFLAARPPNINQPSLSSVQSAPPAVNHTETLLLRIDSLIDTPAGVGKQLLAFGEIPPGPVQARTWAGQVGFFGESTVVYFVPRWWQAVHRCRITHRAYWLMHATVSARCLRTRWPKQPRRSCGVLEVRFEK